MRQLVLQKVLLDSPSRGSAWTPSHLCPVVGESAWNDAARFDGRLYCGWTSTGVIPWCESFTRGLARVEFCMDFPFGSPEMLGIGENGHVNTVTNHKKIPHDPPANSRLDELMGDSSEMLEEAL